MWRLWDTGGDACHTARVWVGLLLHGSRQAVARAAGQASEWAAAKAGDRLCVGEIVNANLCRLRAAGEFDL